MQNKWKIHDEFFQVSVALIALILGILIYATTRSSQQVFFLQYLPELDLNIPFQMSSIIYSLPSFLHIYAFILLTAAVAQKQIHHVRYICLFWLVVEVLFEFGQQHDIAIAFSNHISGWFSHYVWLETIPNYFLHGTFDPLDIMCLVLGMFAAFATLMKKSTRGIKN